MTNFEYYKERIDNINKTDCNFGISKYNGIPIECKELTCHDCKFKDKNGGTCSYERIVWSHEEYTKHPKLTKKERQFCELVETGWIVRGELGGLNFWIKKPEKRHQGAYGYWLASSNDDKKYNNEIGSCLNMPFSFITWDDAEPWSIEDLLKLEVEE